MNHEILFRGKQVEIGPFATETRREWVYGGYARDSSGTYIYDHMRAHRMVKVDPATVGQWTGRTDKCNQQIFEGDVCVVDCEDGYFKLVWNTEDAMFQLEGDGLTIDFGNCYPNREVEVVGNVTDDPKLLEGGNANG